MLEYKESDGTCIKRQIEHTQSKCTPLSFAPDGGGSSHAQILLFYRSFLSKCLPYKEYCGSVAQREISKNIKESSIEEQTLAWPSALITSREP